MHGPLREAPSAIHKRLLAFRTTPWLRGIQASRRVGRILIDTGGGLRARGTGFLIGSGVVLTNEHVLRTQEQAATCFIQMDYEQNRFAPNPQPQLFAFEPARLFLNNRSLDFAIVAVAPRSNQGAGMDQYGWLTLNEAQGKITVTPDDFVNIIQHPLGREKEVVAPRIGAVLLSLMSS